MSKIFRVLSKNMSNVDILKQIFQGAVASVQPAALIKNQIKVDERHLHIGRYKFPLRKACYMVGFGKAVAGMAVELERALGSSLERALVTVPEGIFRNFPDLLSKQSKIDFVEGARDNLPDERAMEGAKAIKQLAEGLKEEDLLVVLISGGGSALLPLPKPPVTLEEKQTIVKRLSRGGATIQELNTVRRQLSVLKGGGLAQVAHPSKVVSLILSDIIDDPVDLIASGPTVESVDSCGEAVEILTKYNLYQEAPDSVKTVLNSPAVSDKGKLNNVTNIIIGNNAIAVRASEKLALKNDWQCVVVSNQVEATVDDLAEFYASLVQNKLFEKDVSSLLFQRAPFAIRYDVMEQIEKLQRTRPVLLIFAGEPTLKVTGKGKGGRNLQLALAVGRALNKQPTNLEAWFLSAGTDGIDGPTDVAGAVVTSRLRYEMAERYLTDNDSYSFFERFHFGQFFIKVGHTGTNVMDLHYLLIKPQ